MKYNTYFENLIRGRQQEFLVYREVYKVSEQLFGKVKLNIYDQITDIDGIDFLIRCESSFRILYIEGQVKKTNGSLTYDSKRGSLRQLVEKAIKTHSNLLVLAVDYTSLEAPPVGIYFYESEELQQWFVKTGKKTFNLKQLNGGLDRDASVSALGLFLLDKLKID